MTQSRTMFRSVLRTKDGDVGCAFKTTATVTPIHLDFIGVLEEE